MLSVDRYQWSVCNEWYEFSKEPVSSIATAMLEELRYNVYLITRFAIPQFSF